jgi:dipeptidase
VAKPDGAAANVAPNEEDRLMLWRYLPATAAAALLLTSARTAVPCTSILVAKGAASDGATLLTYAADSHVLYGDLVLRPAGVHIPGATIDIIDWDEGHRRGEIEQAPRTYAVVGQINEHQVSIGETTFGGREELVDPLATIDYGSLMYLALQRSTSAREAVRVMTELAAKHGFASEGESFSIADPNEAWLLEMVGKGPGGNGALWVAWRVPDGMLTAHANQARIRRFPRNDPKNVLFAKDVVSFARARGWFSGRDEEFSFADAYAPLTGDALRRCEARVWSVFRRAAPSLMLDTGYFDYILGKPGAKPLPLWIKPDKPLSVRAVMELMRDHFEGTPLDMRHDVGAGPYHLPYRWRPMTFTVDGVEYTHERAISTQQTGFSVVAQARSSLPSPIGGVLWFGVDDTFSTVYVPIYAGVHKAPPSFAPGVATLHRFSWDSAFWVFNWVSNFAYGRYDEMIRDIQKVQRELEGDFAARQAGVEAAAKELHARSPELARNFLTEYSVAQAERTVSEWRRLGEALLVKYMDGNVKDERGLVLHPPYAEDWHRRIVADKGAALRLAKLPGEPAERTPVPHAGYFHGHDELGPAATAVPKDFSFTTEKLALVPGANKCKRPPRCCATAVADEKGDSLRVVLPKEEGDACGVSDWLVRLPRAENRPLYLSP